MSAPRKRAAATREPVQVYLAADDRTLLDRVSKKAGLPYAEVLRRGVRRMAAEVLADESPMMALMEELAGDDWSNVPSNAAEHHDAYLTDRPTPATASPKREAKREAKRPKRGR